MEKKETKEKKGFLSSLFKTQSKSCGCGIVIEDTSKTSSSSDKENSIDNSSKKS